MTLPLINEITGTNRISFLGWKTNNLNYSPESVGFGTGLPNWLNNFFGQTVMNVTIKILRLNPLRDLLIKCFGRGFCLQEHEISHDFSFISLQFVIAFSEKIFRLYSQKSYPMLRFHVTGV